MKTTTYPDYIEVLRANTDGSVRESLQLLKNDRFKKNYLPSEM